MNKHAINLTTRVTALRTEDSAALAALVLTGLAEMVSEGTELSSKRLMKMANAIAPCEAVSDGDSGIWAVRYEGETVRCAGRVHADILVAGLGAAQGVDSDDITLLHRKSESEPWSVAG